MANFRDLLRRVKADTSEATPEEVKARLGAGEKLVFLDVREESEAAQGIVSGARHLGRAHFESRVEDIVPDKSAPVVVYCASGVRSAFAARTLAELGYENVTSMVGGFTRWRELGYEFKLPRFFSSEQKDRY